MFKLFFHGLRSIMKPPEDKVLSKIPTSLFKRSTKLLGAAGKIALSEVSSKLKTWEDEKEKLKARVDQAQELVKTLSHLKGASMKLGQLLSLDFGDYLPPEVLKILEQLHQKSTFLPFEDIEKILRAQLGEKFQEFDDISPEPIAAASIGQVHKAHLNGQDVVLKVQYPGIAEAIPSDLKILELLLKQINLIQFKKEADIKPLLNEVKEVLLKEADYEHEIQMHQKYREKFIGSPFLIPSPFPDYSTSKVLVQEFVFGLSFSDWLATSPSYELRYTFADLLMKLYLEEIFIHHMVQTDPNPGNFMVTPQNKIALIDFGAVKEYSESFVKGYREVLLSSHKGDQQKILEISSSLGLIDPRESNEVKEIYLKMMNFLVDPFRRDEPFDFTDKNFLNESRDLSWELARKSKYTPPPKELIFLHRKLGGIFVFIKRLDVKIKLRDYWHYVESASTQR